MSQISAQPARTLSARPGVIGDLKKNGILIAELVRRQMGIRTSGTMLGIIWWVLTPLLLLIAYMFAFRFILGVRWPQNEANPASTMQHATQLFAGLIVYQFFSEAILGATRQITTNEQYVRRVVFPIQTLPVIPVVVSGFGLMISTLVLIIMVASTGGGIQATAILAPVAMLPALLTALGLAWLVAALCVFLRDLEHLLRVLMLGIMFLSPIFYPLSRLEDAAGSWVSYFHPLAVSMNQVRACVFDPSSIGSLPWLSGLGIGLVLVFLGHTVFTRLKPMMADVL